VRRTHFPSIISIAGIIFMSLFLKGVSGQVGRCTLGQESGASCFTNDG
jgi:hypothetical protein